MNKRVATRHFRRLQYNVVSTGSSERTTALDRMAFAIGSFQPGTLLLRRVHTETFYQKVRVDAKCLIWRGVLLRVRESEEALLKALPSSFKLPSHLNMYTLSR